MSNYYDSYLQVMIRAVSYFITVLGSEFWELIVSLNCAFAHNFVCYTSQNCGRHFVLFASNIMCVLFLGVKSKAFSHQLGFIASHSMIEFINRLGNIKQD